MSPKIILAAGLTLSLGIFLMPNAPARAFTLNIKIPTSYVVPMPKTFIHLIILPVPKNFLTPIATPAPLPSVAPSPSIAPFPPIFPSTTPLPGGGSCRPATPAELVSGNSRFSLGTCQADADCQPAGCSGQLCSNDPEIFTTCEFCANFPNRQGLSCGCVNTKCGWR